jgi:hypothetical protein
MKKLLFAPLLFFCISAFGQSYTLQGTITDTVTNKPIEGVIVNLFNSYTTVSATTDDKGHYFFDSTLVTPNHYYIITIDAEMQSYDVANEAQEKVYLSTIKGTPSKDFIQDFRLQKLHYMKE